MVIRRVDDGEFALFGLGKDGVGFSKSGARGGGDEIGGHDGCHGVGEVRMELDIACRYHANERGAEGAVFCSESVSGINLDGCSRCEFWRFLIGLKIVSPQYDEIVWMNESYLCVFDNHRKADSGCRRF